jgi:hypothetical protein
LNIKTGNTGVVKNPAFWDCSKLVPNLIRDTQMQGAQKNEPRGGYRYSLSGAVYNAADTVPAKARDERFSTDPY